MRSLFSRVLVVGLLIMAAVLAVALPYHLSHREVQHLDAGTRSQLGGKYARLAVGVTHYVLDVPSTKSPSGGSSVVVLVHGGTIPLWNWDVQVPALTAAGYTVLLYDHLGRGYSDRPAGPYDRRLYRRQLEQLLAHLGIRQPVDLVGISFGAATAASFTAANPRKVRKLVLLAPVVHYSEGKALFSLASVPGLGEWYARVVSVPGTVKRAAKFFAESGADPGYNRRFQEQILFAGYERALLSMSRTDALTDYRPIYRALGAHPVLLVWGDADRDIPEEHIAFLRRTLTTHKYLQLAGAGHGLNIQRSPEINRAIVNFLGPPR